MSISTRSKSTLFFYLFSLIFISNAPVSAQILKPEKQFKLRGQIKIDADHYDAFFDDKAQKTTTNIELRQAKITAIYKPFEHWKSKLQLKYKYENSDNKEYGIADAYITYTGFAWLDILTGKMKEPFSLERLTGASSLTSIERSMVTDAFAPDRSYGVQLVNNKKHYTWALGVFQKNTDRDATRSITARTTFAPVQTNQQTLHLGMSVSIRDRLNQTFQVKESAELNTADNIIRSARFDANKSYVNGFESVWQYQPIKLQSELFFARTEDVTGMNWNYSGFYLQASGFVTGEHADYKKGRFKNIVPVSWTGALELVVRYSELNLRDHKLGSESSVLMAGINFHWSKNIKLMANYLMTTINGNTLNTNNSGKAVSARIYLLF